MATQRRTATAAASAADGRSSSTTTGGALSDHPFFHAQVHNVRADSTAADLNWWAPPLHLHALSHVGLRLPIGRMGSSSSTIRSELHTAVSTDISEHCGATNQVVQSIQGNVIHDEGCPINFSQNATLRTRCNLKSVTDVMVRAAQSLSAAEFSAANITGGSQSVSTDGDVDQQVRTKLDEACPSNTGANQSVRGNNIYISCFRPTPDSNPFALSTLTEAGAPTDAAVNFMQNADQQTVCRMSEAYKAAARVQEHQRTTQGQGLVGAPVAAVDDLGSEFANLFRDPVFVVGLAVVVVCCVVAALVFKKRPPADGARKATDQRDSPSSDVTPPPTPDLP